MYSININIIFKLRTFGRRCIVNCNHGSDAPSPSGGRISKLQNCVLRKKMEKSTGQRQEIAHVRSNGLGARMGVKC